MTLILGDKQRFSELKIFFENIKALSDKLNNRLKEKRNLMKFNLSLKIFN